MSAMDAALEREYNNRARVSEHPAIFERWRSASAAFREQTRQLQRAWPANCRTAEEIAGCNHFTIVDDFVRPDRSGFQFISGLFA